MLWLLRMGAYAAGALAIWQYVQNQAVHTGLLTHGHLALEPSQAMIFGVCSGISKYTGIDVTLIRIAWALLSIYWRAGIVFYLIAFYIMPAS